ALCLVPPARPQRQIRDHIVQFRHDRAWDDVIHRKLVTLVWPLHHGGSLAAPHLGKARVIKAAELVRDVEVTQQSVLGELGAGSVRLACERKRTVENVAFRLPSWPSPAST